MKPLKRLLAFTSGMLIALNAAGGSSPVDSLTVVAELSGSGATNQALRPLWSYSGRWGRDAQYSRWEGSVWSQIKYEWTNGSWLNLRTAAALQASTDRDRCMLHEAYLAGRLWIVDFTLGREAFTPIEQYSGLGLGSYLMSDNARPIWKGGLGFFDWYSIPGIQDWVQFKGGLYLGRMPDEDGVNFTSNVLIHEKFAYLRIGHFRVKPFIGLVHSVMMGGTLANGTVVPVDFWASFFGRGSSKLYEKGFEGEYYNAAGAHQGMWDLGIDADFDSFSGSLFYRRPFGDITAINLFDFARCKDFNIGIDVSLKDFRPVRELCLEFQTWMWQGGNGPADPTFISTGPERTGEVIGLAYRQISPETIRKYFAASTIKEWEAEHGPLSGGGCHEFMVKYANKGVEFGNRTPYLYNAFYPQGWTVGGLSMGSYVPMTDKTMSAVAPGYNFFARFPDLRTRVLGLGLTGQIMPALSYRAKISRSTHCGSYCEQYYYGIDFDKKRPNYYFETPKNEVYTMVGLDWRIGRWSVFTTLAGDFGDIYDCFSVSAGVRIKLK